MTITDEEIIDRLGQSVGDLDAAEVDLPRIIRRSRRRRMIVTGMPAVAVVAVVVLLASTVWPSNSSRPLPAATKTTTATATATTSTTMTTAPSPRTTTHAIPGPYVRPDSRTTNVAVVSERHVFHPSITVSASHGGPLTCGSMASSVATNPDRRLATMRTGDRVYISINIRSIHQVVPPPKRDQREIGIRTWGDGFALAIDHPGTPSVGSQQITIGGDPSSYRDPYVIDATATGAATRAITIKTGMVAEEPGKYPVVAISFVNCRQHNGVRWGTEATTELIPIGYVLVTRN